MDKPLIPIALASLLLGAILASSSDEAKECVVYTLTPRNFASKHFTVREPRLEIATYSRTAKDFPVGLGIFVDGLDNKRYAHIQINKNRELFAKVGPDSSLTGGTAATVVPKSSQATWYTFLITLSQQQLTVSLHDDVAPKISTMLSVPLPAKVFVVYALVPVDIIFNCASGCPVYSPSSTIINANDTLPIPSTIYTRRKEDAADPLFMFQLVPAGHGSLPVNLNSFHLDIEDGHGWHKQQFDVEIRDRTMVVTLGGQPFSNISDSKMTVGNWSALRIVQIRDVFWTINCDPELKQNFEFPQNSHQGGTNGTGERSSRFGGTAVGMSPGEVAAWAVGSLALCLVLILALTLCTRLMPAEEKSVFGPSLSNLDYFDRFRSESDLDALSQVKQAG